MILSESQKKTLNKMNDGKQIEVHIANLETQKILRVRYTMNGKRQCREIRYARCGLEEAMRRAKEMKEEVEMTLSE